VIEVTLPGAKVAFSDRRGGVSNGPYDSLNLGILTDDDNGNVAENRRRLAAGIGSDPERVAMGWQVHGDEILEWDGPPQNGGFAHVGADLPKVDGHTTTAKGVPLMVLVADCLPVALVTPERAVMLHCGWRGLAAGIIERGIALFDDGETRPRAVLGPSIGPCCYEVGEELRKEFGPQGGDFFRPGPRGKPHLDVRAANVRQLEQGGLTPDHIHHVADCTMCRADLYHSYRREGKGAGRMISFVGFR
jgi:purine-nucleoside/S-methyl-5'-thioadenosine phosphorylase / adenosine deaminase